MPIIIQNTQVKTIKNLISTFPPVFEFAGRNWESIREIHWLDFPESSSSDGGFAAVVYFDGALVLSFWRMKSVFENYFATKKPEIAIQYH